MLDSHWVRAINTVALVQNDTGVLWCIHEAAPCRVIRKYCDFSSRLWKWSLAGLVHIQVDQVLPMVPHNLWLVSTQTGVNRITLLTARLFRNAVWSWYQSSRSGWDNTACMRPSSRVATHHICDHNWCLLFHTLSVVFYMINRWYHICLCFIDSMFQYFKAGRHCGTACLIRNVLVA